MVLSPHTYQFLVGVFASVGSILYGYDLGVIAEVVGSSSYIDLFHPTDAETYDNLSTSNLTPDRPRYVYASC
ncbi:hypothetical protein VTK73DRAFT_2871 [Phialemonium thermophilum]|uniref:Major facilitator superfamily (MFS) profile domain-containing protein n=1 Tax=Phialemonium thermophilum TaxID=223376 RepID=A0ABR3VQU0_9PEZI